MILRTTPALILAAGLLAAAAGALWAIHLALQQPWMGLDLQGTENGGVRVAATDTMGPNGAMPPGSRIVWLAAGTDGERIALRAGDLTEEPDAVETYAEMDAFLRRQGQLHDILLTGEAHAEVVTPAARYPDATLSLRPRRGIVDLPLLFWVQVLVGVTGLAAGTWVWSLRRQDLAAFFFALAGAGLFASALPAAIYSTRELALPTGLFTALSGINHAGALIFGAGMIGLFLNYPRRLVSGRASFVPVLVALAYVCVDVFRLAGGPPFGRYLPIVLAMAAILVCVGVQYRATRGDPAGRAALRWLGLSVLIGAGTFVLTVILPELFGAEAALSQGYGFLLFLLIYAGLALGLTRYRLFELEQWAFRVLFYMAGIVLIIVLDVMLVFVVSVEEIPAFSLSFIAVALLYLPFRDALWRRVFVGREPDREKLFAKVVDVALSPPGKNQGARWRALLENVFDPLHIDTAEPRTDGGIGEDGMVLTVPATDGIPALRLRFAHRGRRLFGRRDEALAEELVTMLHHALDSRRAYDTGVAEERARIARDMHDNIGAQLQGALHSREADRKNMMIRDTLSDLRDIVNNATRPGLSLADTLADLRAETAERLNAAEIELDWQVEGNGNDALSPHQAHALRSVIREAVSNVIRHAGAGRVHIAFAGWAGELRVSVEDDGCGYEPGTRRQGNGLDNMRARVEGLKGAIEIAPSDAGTRIHARFPLDPRKGDA